MVSAPEAVKDSTLRNGGICRGVHHYQIIARRQDSEPPLPHGVAVCGLPTWSLKVSAFRPTSVAIFIRQEHFAASCALPGSPYSGTPVQCRDLSHPRFPNHTNGHCSKSPILRVSAGRSCVGARKITQVPVHKLATDLGFRHVDQVLEFAISHAGSSRETKSRIILTPCIA